MGNAAVKLREYQQTAVERCLHEMGGNCRPLLVSPTGSGKTVMAVELIRRLNVPTLFVAHRRELIHQCRTRLTTAGLPAPGIILAGEPEDRGAMVQVASIQTLARREKPRAEFVIIDEAHHCQAASYRSLMGHYFGRRACGLTATPVRTDGRLLSDMFSPFITAATTADLIDNGSLAPMKVFTAATAPDLRGARTTAGDYNLGDLDRAVNKAELTAGAVEEYRKKADGKRAVVFCVSVAHAAAMAEMFRAAGVSAAMIDGETPKEERALILARFKAGDVKVVANCGVLTEGWDCPEVECIILARPTQSLGLYIQMVGRGGRPAEGKEACIVLDHAGNALRHGLPTEIVDWERAQEHQREIKKGVKRSKPACLNCGYIFAKFERRLPECPECGAAKPLPTIAEGQLIVPDARGNGDGASLIRQLNAIQQQKGYKPGWVAVNYKEITGRWPSKRDVTTKCEDPDPSLIAHLRVKAAEWRRKQRAVVA